MTHSRIEKIQTLLQAQGIPGWLFYDFRGLDPIAHRVLGLDPEAHATRRWFYLVPAEGTPQKLVHRIEESRLDTLPGEKRVYLHWQELESELSRLLAGTSGVAMQYSPSNAIPYVSNVDAGTVELVRKMGPEVLSSANLIQHFECVLSPEQLADHRQSANHLGEIVREAFEQAAQRIKTDGETDEITIQRFILEEFERRALRTDFPPIVAVNQNAGNPHYSPEEGRRVPVRAGDFLLVDLWARNRTDEDSIFADITWTGYFGARPPQKIQQVFSVVAAARNAGVDLLRSNFEEGQITRGWEVDDAVRGVIQNAGYGEAFIHRTGHNLGQMVHGNGVNFDNLESHDTREVIPGVACTIEPGIYLKDFGVRSEINIYMGSDGPEVTTAVQAELLTFPEIGHG